MKARLCLCIVLLAGVVRAQTNEFPALHLSSPRDYQVFQRQANNEALVVVEGQLEKPDRKATNNPAILQARLIGKSVTGDLPETWQPLPFDIRVEYFRGTLTVPAGGWYRLQLRLVRNGKILFTNSVEHVGAGEIFLVAGQSNAANHGEGRQQAQNPLVVAFGDGRWQPAKDPEPGATGKGGSFMPAFGDAMADRFKVAIGIVPLAVGATSVREWLPKGDAVAAPPDTGNHVICVGSNAWVSSGELFSRITEAEKTFGTNGFRALLWHQGESDCFESPDRQITPATYRQYLQRVIEASRASAGWRVPWFVAQASYHPDHPEGSPELRAAQKSLVTDGIAMAGPNTDELGPEWRQNNGKGIHFNARGLQKHGELWAGIVGDWLEQQLTSRSAK